MRWQVPTGWQIYLDEQKEPVERKGAIEPGSAGKGQFKIRACGF